MYNYVTIPYMPTNPVSLVVMDRRVPKSIENKIRAKGINIIKAPYCEDLYSAVSSHPDMLLFPVGNEEIIVAPNIYDNIYKIFKTYNFRVIKGYTEIKSTYPEDVAYNVCRVGGYAIHNFRYTDKEILKKLDEQGIKKIQVNQGYAKCSVAIVNNNSIITSDKGIAKEVLKHNIDVLLISCGFIKLPGLNYGFIGGASGLIDKDKIFFCGNIKKHPDYKRILEFLRKHNCDIDFVEEEELVDMGSIIPLLQC